MKNIKIFVICGILAGAVAGAGFVVLQDQGLEEVIGPTIDDDGGEWHTIAVWQPGLSPLGEATIVSGTGIASVFLLDYAQDPFVVLKQNATDWSASGAVHSYVDNDNFVDNTVPSEDPFFFVVRCRFTKDVCFDAGDNMFEGNRTKVTITFSGDEAGTIVHYCNETDGATGGGVASENNSGNASFWANFWFDDGADGYRLTDDGTITVDSIVVSAKY